MKDVFLLMMALGMILTSALPRNMESEHYQGLLEENAYIMGYERCEEDYSVTIMDQEEIDMGKTISEWTPRKEMK